MEVDVRIIAATNADLVALVGQERFKQDLLDRLSFEVLVVPPLRERKEDILLLANHFARRMAIELDRDEIPKFGNKAAAALGRYPWPGNVRELKNVVEREVYRSSSPLIHEIVFSPFDRPPTLGRLPEGDSGEAEEEPSLEGMMAKTFDDAVTELKIRLLRQALRQAKYNQRRAAANLGLSYHQFRGLYRKYGKQLL